MGQGNVFISYRRDGGAAMAGRISDHLTAKGYTVFFDMETIHSGKFNDQIVEAICTCDDVLLVLPPRALDRCVDEEDWVRKEVRLAIQNGKNIIPIIMPGFVFPDVLPADMDSIRYMEGVMVANEYFSSMIERIEGFLTCNQKKKNQDAFAQGNVVGGRYEVVCEIGRGASATVYLAVDTATNMQVAIKRIRSQDCINYAAVLEQAKKEFEIQKSCVHSGISVIRGCFETADEFSIVMDYIEGEDLFTMLENRGRILEAEVVAWGIQICTALQYLHTKEVPVFMGDIKPANVMIKKNGEAILVDFGAAQPKQTVCLADTTVLGTNGYAAPEQYMGIRNACTDIFNLGMTLYHALTGLSPYECYGHLMSVRDVVPELSKDINKIIAKCTNLYVADRYQTVAALKKDLEKLAVKSKKRSRIHNWLKKK